MSTQVLANDSAALHTLPNSHARDYPTNQKHPRMYKIIKNELVDGISDIPEEICSCLQYPSSDEDEPTHHDG